MKRLLFIICLFASANVYSQEVVRGDTIQEVGTHPDASYTGSLKELSSKSELKTHQSASLQGNDMEVVEDYSLPPYVAPLPWTDIKKFRFSKNLFKDDFQRTAGFLLSPEAVLSLYGSHTTYPAMGFIRQTGAGVAYLTPDGHWLLSGGAYAAQYSTSARGPQWDAGVNASVTLHINPYLSISAFGQYSAYGKSNSMHGYMNPMYPQSNFGVTMQTKVTDWLYVVGGVERKYDPTKMKWTTVPIFYPVFNFFKNK